jgi:glycosyltransferase involved in cell wall biosynthesis
MRIAFVSVSGQLGGSEVVLIDLVNQVRRLRPSWILHLIAPGCGPLSERARAAGVAVQVVPMPDAVAHIGESGRRDRPVSLAGQLVAAAGALPAYEARFRNTLAAIGPDIIHSNGLKAHVLTARAHGQARRLWHLHEYVRHRPLTRGLLRWYAPRCDVWVANSASVSSDVERAAGDRLQSPRHVIPNGVDLQRFTPEGPRVDLDALAGLPPAPAGTVRVGLISTFSRWKGHEVFLRAIRRIPPAVGVRAYVVGGPLYDTAGSQFSMNEMRDLAREAGCEDRVGFTGFQPNAPSVMRSLDVVVHASTAPEPFGLVLTEAMACGRALVTSAAGGSAEIVEPDVNALVHTPGDPESLARAITRLALDPGLRARLGRAGREHVVARYDLRAFGERFVRVYEGLSGDVR